MKMIKEMRPQITTLKTLFETKKGLKQLGNFLINTEIATRRSTLGDVTDNDENA
jgi:hypothetical protein